MSILFLSRIEMCASMKWRIIFEVAYRPPPPHFCWGLVRNGRGEAAVDVREVALPTRMSMRQADSSFVEHIVRLGKP